MAVVAHQRLRRHRRAQVHDERELARVVDDVDRERAHERRAVGEREPFLGLEHERLQAELQQDVGGLADLALVEDLGLAGECAADVGERDEVA